MNKREFIAAAASAGGALATAPARVRSAPSVGHDGVAPAPGGASYAAWQAAIGERFAVGGGAGVLRLERIQRHALDASVDQFTLVFSTALGASVAGSRLLRGGDGRWLALYLDNAGSDAAGRSLLRADCAQLVRG